MAVLAERIGKAIGTVQFVVQDLAPLAVSKTIFACKVNSLDGKSKSICPGAGKGVKEMALLGVYTLGIESHMEVNKDFVMSLGIDEAVKHGLVEAVGRHFELTQKGQRFYGIYSQAMKTLGSE